MFDCSLQEGMSRGGLSVGLEGSDIPMWGTDAGMQLGFQDACW